MQRQSTLRGRLAGAVSLFAAGLLMIGAPSFADNDHTSKKFEGVKANTGTVMHTQQGDKEILTLSDDFIVPDAPAPHWQIVDSLGNVYLLESLKIKGDKIHRQITVPSYVHNIAKVQIWCAWAETLLGETTFHENVKLYAHESHAKMTRHDQHTSKKFEGVKANTGTVTHYKQGGQNILTLSDDFKMPDAPAPHWQIVDSKGKTYLLQRLAIKGDKMNRTISLPSYIPDIARVQIWCAWAEVLLGETTFGRTVGK